MDTPQGLHGVSVRLSMGTPQGLHGVSVRLSMTRLTWNFCHNYGETIRLTWSGRFCVCVCGQDLHGAVVSVCLCVDRREDLHEAVVSVCLCVDKTYMERSFLSVSAWTRLTWSSRFCLCVCVWTRLT